MRIRCETLELFCPGFADEGKARMLSGWVATLWSKRVRSGCWTSFGNSYTKSE
jgi:hypothetical protein